MSNAPKDTRLADGTPATADNMMRLIWYGACGYWTDDWAFLVPRGKFGIPCCPHCGAPGFQTTAKEWFDGIAVYDRTNPGYAATVERRREACPIHLRRTKAAPVVPVVTDALAIPNDEVKAAVRSVLEQHGCDCPCECERGSNTHDADCDYKRCLACVIAAVVRA